METLWVSLLGGFDVEAGGEPLPPIPSRAGRSLLAYLLVHRCRAHPREELAAQFWPDLPEARARRRLSQTLWQVQDSLSELSGDKPYVEATTDALAFNDAAPYWLDVEEFETCLAGLDEDRTHPLSQAERLAALELAVDLYRGDFLSGFYDDWVVREQDRLQQRYLDALQQLVRLRKGGGDYQQALAYARRVTHHDPLREEAHREVMRLCVLLGRTSEALRQYERCRCVLAEELGQEPAAATRELYDKIARQRRVSGGSRLPDDVAPTTVRADVPLVGRDPERGVLLDRLEHALSGRGSTVLIEGEPGIGKSRLVAEFGDDAEWRGFSVLWGPCREHGCPYEPLAEAIDGALSPLRVEQLASRVDPVWIADVAQVVPRLRRVAPQLPGLAAAQTPHRVREAFARMLVELARLVPTVLVIEDLHWADEATLASLETVTARLGGAPLVVVLTYRGQDARQRAAVWDAIRAVDRHGRPDRLVLEPLTAFGTAELLRNLHGRGDLPPRFSTRLHSETGGNPLFVLETLEALVEQGTLEAAVHGALPLPRTIADVIATRLTTLGSDARAVLATAAVHGGPVDLETLRRSADVPVDRALGALDELLRRGLLTERGDGYRFAHDQIGRVVVRTIDDADKIDLHRRLATTLAETRPGDVEALAHHALAGDLLPTALRHLVAAAERAESLSAFETAARHYAQATALLDRVPVTVDERYRVLAAHETVVELLGDRQQQDRLLAELAVLAGSDPARQADVHRRRAMLYAHTDRFDLAEQEARAALALDEGSRHASLMTLGTVLRWAGRVPDAAACLEEAVSLGGDPAAVAEANRALGAALHELRRYPPAAAALTRALQTFDELGDMRGRALSLGALAAVAMETGDSASAEARYRAAVELDVRIGFREAEGRDRLNLANLLASTGRPQGALDQYGAAAAIFRDIGHGRGTAMVRMNAAWLRETVLGDVDVAERDAQSALAYFRDLGDVRLQAFCLGILGDIERQRGRLDAARQRLVDAVALATSAGDAWILAQLSLGAATVELSAGDHGRALTSLNEAASACLDHGFADLAVTVRAQRGLALLGIGRVHDAVAATTDAVAELRPGVPRPWLIHDVHRRALSAAGRPADAEESLARARAALLDALADLPENERDAAIERVAEHRSIVEDWESGRPPEIRVRLAAAAAPTGRPLRDDERVPVIFHLADDHGLAADDRRRRLVQVVDEAWAQGAAPTVEDLASLLHVSVPTVYRDLKALRAAGHRIHTRGSRVG
ncbi:MAG: AAA family ATPase [Actinobacteria bacterium]|nr:AAA family ATPase [Actinomycetota bacterium]